MRRLKRKRNQADESTITNEVAEIKSSITRESESKQWKDFLKDDKVRSRRRVLITVIIRTLQAFSGSIMINIMLPSYKEQVRFSHSHHNFDFLTLDSFQSSRYMLLKFCLSNGTPKGRKL